MIKKKIKSEFNKFRKNLNKDSKKSSKITKTRLTFYRKISETKKFSFNPSQVKLNMKFNSKIKKYQLCKTLSRT